MAYIVTTLDRQLVIVPGGNLGPASAAPLVFYDVDIAYRAANQTGRHDLVIDLVSTYADTIAP